MLWYVRGLALAILLMGALNAGSYFVRSEQFGDLLGVYPSHNEVIGFPWIVWQKNDSYDGWFMNYPAFFANAGIAVAAGLLLGGVAFAYRESIEQLVREMTHFESASPRKAKFQFSLRGLLALMAISGIVAAGVGQIMAGRPQALGLIYAFGPWALVGLAYVPARIGWRQRVALIIPLTIVLISVAVVAGAMLQPPREFDKTLLGIFVCWTPQAALAAIVIAGGVIANHLRQRQERRRLLAAGE